MLALPSLIPMKESSRRRNTGDHPPSRAGYKQHPASKCSIQLFSSPLSLSATGNVLEASPGHLDGSTQPGPLALVGKQCS